MLWAELKVHGAAPQGFLALELTPRSGTLMPERRDGERVADTVAGIGVDE